MSCSPRLGRTPICAGERLSRLTPSDAFSMGISASMLTSERKVGVRTKSTTLRPATTHTFAGGATMPPSEAVTTSSAPEGTSFTR